MNRSGKTLTIILVVISILSLTLTVIAVFFFQKESELRKMAEDNLAQTKISEAKLQSDLKESKKQGFLLEEKVKEADEKINNLMDELELAEGVRDEIKAENETLKEALENESQSKEQIRQQLTEELNNAEEKVGSLEQELNTEKNLRTGLESQLEQLQNTLKSQASQGSPSEGSTTDEPPSPDQPQSDETNGGTSDTQADREGVDLEKIIVASSDIPSGKVLSVDKENDFVIFNLGQRHGIVQGLVMSIYRDDNYLGDVKVSRVQDDMSAADFIPPFSSQNVRKNDQIVTKQ